MPLMLVVLALAAAAGRWAATVENNWQNTGRANMESTESNIVSKEEALEYARAWKEKGATLLLSISSGLGKRDICDKLVGHLSYVDDNGAFLTFVWRMIEPSPQSSDMTFVDGDGKFVIRLEGTSFSTLSTSQKSMIISRGPYRCVLTEWRASAFG